MQDRPCVAVAQTIGSAQLFPLGELGLVPARRAWVPRSIDTLFKLGAGRAARAMLVRARDQTGRDTLCVEKVFRPNWLTRLIYRCAFQAPFAYQHSEDAILACFYRRRVAARMVEAMVPGARVAEPLYVRWDRMSRSFVLGSELIPGRGIRPAMADLQNLRRAWKRGFEKQTPREQRQPQEIDELLRVMSRLESLFQECGLVGSGWQVSRSAFVATANLLRTKSEYVVVDLESGIPAMLVPYYIGAGRQLKSLPLFDDIDPRALRSFLESHWPKLQAKLGRAGFLQLSDDVEALIDHTQRWKQAETALGRRSTSIWSKTFRKAYRHRCFDIWRRHELIDPKTEAKLRSSSRLWSRPLYWLGWIPGAPGRLIQRLCGNRDARRRAKQAILHHSVRHEFLAEYCERKTALWRQSGRISSERVFRRLTPSFVWNCLIAKVTPPAVHRWLSDGQLRRTQLMRLVLLLVSGRFQREYGRQAIRRTIRSWSAAGRLYPSEQAALNSEAQSHELDEYARCLGMHLSLKLITPVLFPLKVGGLAAFAATHNPQYLLPILFSPIVRTGITLWRMARNRSRGVPYGEALAVGMLPVVGNLAYPVQMYAAHKQLAIFLIRDSAARVARMMPVYGGRNSRLEIAAVKATDIPIELLEIGLSALSWVRRWLPRGNRPAPTTVATVAAPAGHWERLVDHHVQLLIDSENADRPVAEQIDELLKQPTYYRKAS